MVFTHSFATIINTTSMLIIIVILRKCQRG